MAGIVTLVVALVCIRALRPPSGEERFKAHRAYVSTFWHSVFFAVPALLVLVMLIASWFFLVGTTHYHGWEGNGGTVEWLFVFSLPTVCFAISAYLAYLHRFGQLASVVALGAVLCILMAGALLFAVPWCSSGCTAEEDAATAAYNQAQLWLVGGGLAGVLSDLVLVLYSVHFARAPNR